MKITLTPFKNLLVVEPTYYTDDRGYFMESYNAKTLEKQGVTYDFVQDNESASSYGVIRGLHYQIAPQAQTKLVRVSQGKVLDVVVDLRKDSPTFGEHYSIILSAENKKQLLIPRGFAHGFSVLSPNAIFAYKCDNYYSKAHEKGLRWNDPALNIDWGIPKESVVVSEKDSSQALLKDISPFVNE